jgi:hypothetical protein
VVTPKPPSTFEDASSKPISARELLTGGGAARAPNALSILRTLSRSKSLRKVAYLLLSEQQGELRVVPDHASQVIGSVARLTDRGTPQRERVA